MSNSYKATSGTLTLEMIEEAMKNALDFQGLTNNLFVDTGTYEALSRSLDPTYSMAQDIINGNLNSELVGWYARDPKAAKEFVESILNENKHE